VERSNGPDSEKELSGHLDPVDVAGRAAALLSLVEIGLGSVLHSFKIPFSGHALSLNQGFFLARATLKVRRFRSSRLMGAHVSSIGSMLKSLSPAGKKLTPMLAICTQGILFSFGTVLLGPNFFGILLGMVLLSLWAFAQPVLIYLILYGRAIIHIADYFFEKFQKVISFDYEDLLVILAIVVTIKVALAVLVSLLVANISDEKASNYENRLILLSKKSKKKRLELEKTEELFWYQHARLALQDLFNPLFILSLAVTAIFFTFVHTASAQIVWTLLRPIGVGFLIFFSLRILPFNWLLRWFEKKGLFPRFMRAFKVAVATLKQV